MQEKKLARAGILLAVAIVVQQLRVLLPLPTPVTTLLIGSIVNCVLLLALRFASLSWAVRMSLVLPCVAFVQGYLFAVFQIPVVFLANVIFVCAAHYCQGLRQLVWAPLLKTIGMALAIMLAVEILGLQGKVNTKLIFMMCWPQLVTGVIGILLATLIAKRLNGE